jgi:hypothetical protein
MTLLDADLRSDHARTALLTDGPAGLLAFRTAGSPACTMTEAGRYADLLVHVAGRLEREQPVEAATVWDMAEDEAHRGWAGDGQALYDWSLVLSRLPGI